MFDVAFEEGDARIFGLRQGDELRAKVEPDRIETLLMQKIGEDPGTAAEIGDACPRFPFRQRCTSADQPLIAFGRENVIAVRGGVTVEERYFFLLILGGFDHSAA